MHILNDMCKDAECLVNVGSLRPIAMQVMGQTMKMTKESTEMYEIYGELNLLYFSIGYDTEQWRREEESM
jgi:hypothetical protein